MIKEQKKLLNVREFAECTGYSPRYVRENLIPNGIINGAFRFGDNGQWRIPMDLNKMLLGLLDKPICKMKVNRIIDNPELLKKRIKQHVEKLHNN